MQDEHKLTNLLPTIQLRNAPKGEFIASLPAAAAINAAPTRALEPSLLVSTVRVQALALINVYAREHESINDSSNKDIKDTHIHAHRDKDYFTKRFETHIILRCPMTQPRVPQIPKARTRSTSYNIKTLRTTNAIEPASSPSQ